MKIFSEKVIPVAVYDNDSSTLSRTYIRLLGASPNLKVTHYLSFSESIEKQLHL
jgi:ABC-2 type transport system permease protein